MKNINIFFIFLTFSVLSCGGSSESPGLAFVFQDNTDISELRCYHLHPWSNDGEIHGGIDISPKYSQLTGTDTIKMTPVVALPRVIERILVHYSGAGAKMFSLVIKMNDYWRIIMSFEPQTTDTTIIAQQEANILVSEGSQITKGELVANLVYGKILTNSYPHIHFGVLYIKPGDTLDTLAADILNVPRNNGIPTPPAREGAGSPWDAQDLGIESQFFCPYLYFTDQAQAVLNAVPKYSVTSELCTCLCAYNSSNGDCGVCAP
jgi:hypothetical protein